MGLLFDKLTEEDKELIDTYIENFAGCNGPREDLEYILREWDTQKEKLYHLFGDNFILKKEIAYNANEDDLIDRIVNIKRSSIFINALKTLSITYKVKGDSLIQNHKFIFSEVASLISAAALMDNYTGENVVILVDENKTIQVQHGCKSMRILSKIADAYGLEGFEEFRLEISRALNQKSIKGNFCLSIHPLDYMTMSDNENDWHSCMNWINEGEFRLGTVEMMNSPYVVVAYMESKTPMEMFNWNNKKWRNLVIVHDDIITTVKDYPYHNDEFNNNIINWIKNLFPIDTYSKNYNFHTDNRNIDRYSILNDNRDSFGNCEFYFSTYGMYNDFANNAFGTCAIASRLITKSEEIEIVYSGKSECMQCGSLTIYPDDIFNDRCCLVCSSCNPIDYCDHCGDAINPNDTYWIDDVPLCYNCYTADTATDYFTGEVHLKSNMVPVIPVLEKIDDDCCYVTSKYYAISEEMCVWSYEVPSDCFLRKIKFKNFPAETAYFVVVPDDFEEYNDVEVIRDFEKIN